MDFHSILINLSQKRPVFHNEADFQHALAWEIREQYPDSKIRLEMKVLGPRTRVYLDILFEYKQYKYAIELKYKTRAFDSIVNEEEYSLHNQGAQDIGRYDVLKDLFRLEQMVSSGVVDDGMLVFLTNDSSYYSNPDQNRNTVDKQFRIDEGKTIQGSLSWSENTGYGTMKGREEPLTFGRVYQTKWNQYSSFNNHNGKFKYLLFQVQDGVISPGSDEFKSPSEEHSLRTIGSGDIKADRNMSTHGSWFDSFSKEGLIPVSQYDLRDKLTQHLKTIGYSVQINRQIGKDKVDIWAEKQNETIAIELRYKTALLKTVYEEGNINLKNQSAQDISRYDFVNDLSKVERVSSQYPDVKGYALLITNDKSYWLPSKKEHSVDRDFRLHEGRVLTGVCEWGEMASPGTTSGREKSILLSGTYTLNWAPYRTIGKNKNEEFKALLVKEKK